MLPPAIIPARPAWHRRRPIFPEPCYTYGYYSEAVGDRLMSLCGQQGREIPFLGEKMDSGIYPVRGRKEHHTRWGVLKPVSKTSWLIDHYAFDVACVKMHIMKAAIYRFKPETLKLKLDLKPEGEEHPNCAAKGVLEMREHDDPALRLGIGITGTYQTRWPDDSERQGVEWVQIGKHDIFKANRIVSWLDGDDLDPSVLRPRIWYNLRHLITGGHVNEEDDATKREHTNGEDESDSSAY